jgi:dihydroneopterin aldolase|tara:strand:+ start:117 stop:515 length:399 start_codon:yes stop_codon:yes gene_type:complete
MKIIKFKDKKKYKYNRKVSVKNLILKISIGLHDFEKKKKQRVRFNIDIITDSNIKPDNNNLLSIVNYEDTINKITSLTKAKHHELLEDLAENIFDIIFKSKIVKKVSLKLEKLDIIKNTESVGIEVSKRRDE